MTKRIVSLVLVAVIMLTSAIGISAVEPRYTYTSDISSTLSISGSTGTCSALITADPDVTKIEMTMILQKKVLWWWDDVLTWNKTAECEYINYSKTCSGLDSGTYRIYVECDVYCGTSYETVYAYSNEVKI